MKTISTFLVSLIAAVILISCGDEGERITVQETPTGDTGQVEFTVQMAPQLAGVKKVTVTVKASSTAESTVLVPKTELKIEGNSAKGEITVQAGVQRFFLVELWGENDKVPLATGRGDTRVERAGVRNNPKKGLIFRCRSAIMITN